MHTRPTPEAEISAFARTRASRVGDLLGFLKTLFLEILIKNSLAPCGARFGQKPPPEK